ALPLPRFLQFSSHSMESYVQLLFSSLQLLFSSHPLQWLSNAVLLVYMPFHFVYFPVLVPAGVERWLHAPDLSLSLQKFQLGLFLSLLHTSTVPFLHAVSSVLGVVGSQPLFSMLCFYGLIVYTSVHRI